MVQQRKDHNQEKHDHPLLVVKHDKRKAPSSKNIPTGGIGTSLRDRAGRHAKNSENNYNNNNNNSSSPSPHSNTHISTNTAIQKPNLTSFESARSHLQFDVGDTRIFKKLIEL